MATDPAGGVLALGDTWGDFAGENEGRTDTFVIRSSGTGQILGLAQIGSSEDDYSAALAPDGSGGVFAAGTTGGELAEQRFGLMDVFLARFGALCYADLDGDGELALFDFLTFTNLFNAGDIEADCDQDKDFTLFDMLCFANAFNAGC